MAPRAASVAANSSRKSSRVVSTKPKAASEGAHAVEAHDSKVNKASAASKKAKSTTTKASAAKKKTAETKATAQSANTKRKREATDDAEEAAVSNKTKRTKAEPKAKAPAKAPKAQPKPKAQSKVKADPKPKAAPKPKAEPKPKAPPKKGKIINNRPTEVLDVFSFGQGDMGELGLGATEDDQDVSSPRLNSVLSNPELGVVQVAVGGMHAAVLTKDGRILTWGVNDHGALGRETGEGEINDDTGLNVLEVTPTAIDMSEFPENLSFTSIAAGDNCTYAVTDDGHVYGWGSYRANEGLLGFSENVENQKTPVLIAGLTKIKSVSCGSNHTLALDTSGDVYSWGAGQKGQLARRITERNIKLGLKPAKCLSRKYIESIAAGENHSFAVSNNGGVWVWGINNYGQCGIAEGAGGDEAEINVPTKSTLLSDHKMKSVRGGVHHSIGISGDDDALVWGRCDNFQIGVDISTVPMEAIITDERERPRIVTAPTVIPDIKAAMVDAASDSSFVVAQDGKVWSWGFGESYRHGQGSDNDIKIARQIKGKEVVDRRISWVGAGAQFGMMAAKKA